MNKAKIGIVLGAIVVVAIGATLLATQQPSVTKRSTTPVSSTPSPQSTLPPPIVPVPQGPLAGISADVLLATYLVPKNFAPVGQWLETRYVTLSNTKLWKKFPVVEMIRTEFENGFKQKRGAAGATAEKELNELYSTLAGASSFVGDLREVLIVASAESFRVDDQLELPRTLVKLTFTSDASSAKFSDLINRELLEGRNKLEGAALRITRDASGYLVNFTPEPGVNITARLVVKQTEVLMLIGSSSEEEFKAKPGASDLVSTESYRRLAQPVSTSAAIVGFVDPPKILAFAKRMIVASNVQSGSEVEKVFTRAWDAISAINYSADFDQGLHSQQCVLAVPGSKYAAVAAEFLKSRKETTAPVSFERLINSETIVAARFLLSGLSQGLNYLKDLIASAPQDAQAAKVTSILAQITSYLERTGVKEAGIVVNAATGMPMPEGGVLLAEATARGDDLLAQSEQLLNALISLAGPTASALTRTTNPAGRTLLSIPGGPAGMPFVAGVINETSLALGMNDEFLTQSETAIRSGPSGFAAFQPLPNNRLDGLSTADVYFFLNTGKAFNLVRGYLPMLLAMGAQGGQTPPVDMEEINEILDFLSVTLLSTQHTTVPSEGILCTDKFASTLTPIAVQ